jgi:hypothetical protein
MLYFVLSVLDRLLKCLVVVITINVVAIVAIVVVLDVVVFKIVVVEVVLTSGSMVVIINSSMVTKGSNKVVLLSMVTITTKDQVLWCLEILSSNYWHYLVSKRSRSLVLFVGIVVKVVIPKSSVSSGSVKMVSLVAVVSNLVMWQRNYPLF